MKTIRILLLLALLSLYVNGQSYQQENILYGVAYYHEYMPFERLEEDVRMMKDAGISVVRLGESTWSLFEPREGEFEFAWMDRVIDKLHEAGIRVILGTPTYSIPAWLWHKHPEILLEYKNGSKAYYGFRQNMDLTNPTYLFYAERIIRKMMEHYANHPGIIGYQVDNETTSRGVNNYDFQVSFVNHLKKKYKTPQNLNKLWGLNYWGMTIDSWEEVPPRNGVSNTAYKLEWARFCRKAVADFLKWQSAIVQEYKRSDQFITHCFMPATHEVDQIESASKMDIIGVNIYHGQQDDLTGTEIAFAGDYFRSVKNTNYLVLETNAQTIGWTSKTQRPAYPGQMRQNVFAHIGSGANMVEYWHWHSIHYGQETYWKGVLSHDLQPNRVYAEVSKTAHELKRIGNKIVNLKKDNEVAILFSHDCNDALNFMPFNGSGSDWEESNNNAYLSQLVSQFHQVMYRNNIGVDFIFPEKPDFEKYKLVIIPALYIASDELLEKINNYVKNGGHVILQFKSGFCDENSMVRPMLAPGPLREACGFYYQEFSNFKELNLKGNPFEVEENVAKDWMEFLIPETAKPLAYYDHPYFSEYPAVTINNFGKGTVLYQGTLLSDQIQTKIIMEAVERAGINSPDLSLSWPLIVKSGKNDDGNIVHFYYNYSSEEMELIYPHRSGVELFSGISVTNGESIKLDEWGVLIIEEK
ncbi:MAG: beta-galactosidase [Bacteroidales bacterium]|nr:beta-galactosidase [Bacteroidales bacterium]